MKKKNEFAANLMAIEFDSESRLQFISIYLFIYGIFVGF